jgi:hypothetical protein
VYENGLIHDRVHGRFHELSGNEIGRVGRASRGHDGRASREKSDHDGRNHVSSRAYANGNGNGSDRYGHDARDDRDGRENCDSNRSFPLQRIVVDSG